jgi:hypothetical protein
MALEDVALIIAISTHSWQPEDCTLWGETVCNSTHIQLFPSPSSPRPRGADTPLNGTVLRAGAWGQEWEEGCLHWGI